LLPLFLFLLSLKIKMVIKILSFAELKFTILST
jgi:hypothetical protein